MDITPDDWLATATDRPVFRVAMLETDASGEPELASAAAGIRGHAECHPGAMYYAKVDTAAVNVCRALMSGGFYVVDVNVTFDWRGAEFCRASTGVAAECRVGLVSQRDEEAVLQIAGSCFRFSRFHLDPLIPKRTADQIKRNWVRSYLRGERGDRLFVAFIGSRPAGFLAALRTRERAGEIAVIDLVGVASAFQRRGVGRMLVTAFVDHYKKTCTRLLVGTQAANIPSMRLYEELGFSVVQTKCVFHMHAAPVGVVGAAAAGR